MNTFLSKISQLDSICDVILLSNRGEPLFFCQDKSTHPYAQKTTPIIWNKLIAKLDNPLLTELLFSDGRFFLQKTDIGYLIIGMRNDSELNRVRIACKNVRDKLTSTAICKQTLLKMLVDVGDDLKPHVIKELMPHADQDLARILIRLLLQHDQFQPTMRNRLVLFICQALGYCSSYEAVKPLNDFLALCTSGSVKPPFGTDVENAVRTAIQQLKKHKPAPGQTVQPPQPQQSSQPYQAPQPTVQQHTAAPLQSPRNTLPRETSRPKKAIAVPDLPESQEINTLLQAGNKREALALIIAAITRYARSRDFSKAEEMRDWLIDIDSMAIGEIIRSAEVIEEAKKAAIDPAHLTIWQDLVKSVSTDAFSALYHSFSLERYASGETIVKQGDLESTLFFINSGKVQFHVSCQGKTELIRTLEQGEIFGSESFFEVSVWTVNAKSLDSELFLLPHTAFHKLKDNYPDLEANLFSYCSRFQTTKSFFEKTRKSRRIHERKRSSNRVSITLINNQGKESEKTTKGELFDISRGGMSLIFHASQKKAADALLGRKVKTAIHCNNYIAPLTRIGTIRAIGGNDPIGNRYSMHLEFDETLSPTELQQAIDNDKKKGQEERRT